MDEKGIVLLVEDNLKILDINRRMLEKEGVMVLSARNIAEAKEKIQLARPDVAVLDIMLPDGSGLEFLSELKAAHETPVNPVYALFLTAKANHEDVLAGLTAGVIDYITKPYDIDEFRMRVLSFLRLARTHQNDNHQNKNNSYKLSKKELIVANLAAQGLANKEIAEKVFLSESRIKTCLSSVYRKLGIADKENKRELLAEKLM